MFNETHFIFVLFETNLFFMIFALILFGKPPYRTHLTEDFNFFRAGTPNVISRQNFWLGPKRLGFSITDHYQSNN